MLPIDQVFRTVQLVKALDTFAVAYRQVKLDRPIDLDSGHIRNLQSEQITLVRAA